MDLVTSQLRHNAWANGVVARALRDTPAASAALVHDGEPLASRLSHLASVERAFLDVLRGQPARPQPPEGLAALAGYIHETGRALVAVPATLGPERLADEFDVPWWGRRFQGGELLAQVLAHSGQHRAEVAWELARAGVDTGELDYIVWAARGRPAPGEPLADE